MSMSHFATSLPRLRASFITAVLAAGALAGSGCHRGAAPAPVVGPENTPAPTESMPATQAQTRAETQTQAQTQARTQTQAQAQTPARKPPRNAAECRRCKGEWGVHGLLQVESCLCRTHDAGKRCRDGYECEGECVVDDGKTEVVDRGPPPRGFFIGKCSEFDHLFGCMKLLMDGTLAEGPTRLDERPADVCID
jgi:hypothetical protein